MRLAPFIRYYGAKYRLTSQGRYPEPRHGTIIEPFAGAAGYSLHFPERRVILVERSPVLAEMWRWLIRATPAEVMTIDPVDSVEQLPTSTPLGARYLVGFAMNAATAAPCRSLAKSGLKLRAAGRRFYGWTEAYRERVASQVAHIKHWQIIEGDYTAAPDIEATWFVDPPYQVAGKHYIHGSSGLDYAALAEWCRSRNGQRIVCEARGATWLPFREIGTAKTGPRSRISVEAVWP